MNLERKALRQQVLPAMKSPEMAQNCAVSGFLRSGKSHRHCIKELNLLDDVLFGENWNNEDIDLKTRSIIVISVFMGRGLADNSLKYHLQTAKKNGVTKKEIAAIITHAAFYAGWPVAWAVFNMAKEIWPDEEPVADDKGMAE